jgi:hypothetical protein
MDWLRQFGANIIAQTGFWFIKVVIGIRFLLRKIFLSFV